MCIKWSQECLLHAAVEVDKTPSVKGLAWSVLHNKPTVGVILFLINIGSLMLRLQNYFYIYGMNHLSNIWFAPSVVVHIF